MLVSDICRSPDACFANMCRIRESDLCIGVGAVKYPHIEGVKPQAV